MKRKNFFLKACALLLSISLLLNGNVANAFANETETSVNDCLVTEESLQNDSEIPTGEESEAATADEAVVDDDISVNDTDDEELSNLGITLEDLKDAPLLTEEYLTDKLETPTSQKWFRVNLDNESGYFRIGFKLGDGANPNYIKYGWTISIYDGSDLSSPNYEVHLTGSASSKVMCFEPCVAYIKVSSYIETEYSAPINQPFDIKAYIHKEPNWETSYDNSIASAIETEAGSTYKGTIYYSNDVDYYKYTTKADGYVAAIFKPDPELASVDNLGYGWDFTILDSSGNALYKYSDTTSCTTMKYAYTPGSTFYFKIESTTYSNKPKHQPYNLSVVFHESDDWESEYNNTINNANPFIMNKEMNGSITSKSDIDVFSIDAAADEEVDFDFKVNKWRSKAADYYGFNLVLLDSNGNTITTHKNICSGETFSYNTKLNLSKGINYIKISNYSDTSSYASVGTDYTFIVKGSGSPNPAPEPTPEPTPTPEGYYTVSYNGLDGVNYNPDIFTTSYKWDPKMKAIKLPTKKNMTKPGFTFKGWKIQSTGKKATKITKKTQNGTTFEAIWKENSYTVKYVVKKPASGVKLNFKVKNSKVKYTASFKIAEYYYKKGIKFTDYYYAGNYKIIGWTRVKNGNTPEFITCQKVSKLIEKNKGKLKLYAVWAPINN